MKSAAALWSVTVLVLLVFIGQASALDEDYRLGSGDLLRISAFGYPDLATEVRVTQSGNITFPLLGEVAVGGLAPHDAEQLLSKKLSDGHFIPQAQISILVTEYQSQRISIIGQVQKPGQYPQTRANRLIDLLAEAGGPAVASGVDTGAGDKVTVLRGDGSRIDVDLAELLSGVSNQNLYVSAGDTIVVPKAAQFYIYGEVQRPGVYRLERGMTISRAISAGGGLTPRGSLRRIIIERHDAEGHDIHVAVSSADSIQPDDVVRVRQSLF